MERALSTSTDSRYTNSAPGKLAVNLGWLSIALGTAELFAARRMSRMLGMYGQESLIRAYGVREIVKGVGILTSPNPTPWLWGRVAGDALDLGTLAYAYRTSPRKRNLAIAMANVATVTALDVLAAQQLGAISHRQEMPARDYSDRSGFPQGIEAARGMAAKADIPADFRTPAPLQPLST